MVSKNGTQVKKWPDDIGWSEEKFVDEYTHKAVTPESVKDIRSVLASEVRIVPVEWLWANRYPKGFAGYLDGETGVGKSTALAADIADLSKHYNVGIVNLEDPIDSVIVPRLIAAGADLSRVRIYEPGVEEQEIKHLLLPRDTFALETWATVRGLKFILIDPAVSYLEKGIDWTSEQDMRQVMDPLAALARKLGGFVLLVRHWTKGAAPKALTQGSGAGTIANASRVGFTCIKDVDDPNVRYMAMVKCNLCAEQPARRYRIEEVMVDGTDKEGKPIEIKTSRVKWDGTTTKTAEQLFGAKPMSPEMLEVKEAILKAGKPQSPKAVAALIGKKDAAVRQLCLSMKRQGYLEQPKKKGFYWPVGAEVP